MSQSLRNRAAYGLVWSAAEHVGVQGLRFVISIVLARQLLPAEFGLVAMLGVFLAVADSVVDSGFGTALVQRKELTHTDECSVFYLNIGFGLAMAVVLWLAAPGIAAFFRAPTLTAIARAFSVVPVIRSFGLVQSSLLTRNVDFRTHAKISLCATPVAGTVAIAMAYGGWGVWSLIAQAILRALMRLVLLWSLCTWRPSRAFSFASLHSLFSFGSKVLAMGLIDTVFQNVYPIVIGRLFSPAELGYYGRAYGTQQLPALTLSRIVRRVTLPVFSSIQDNKQRLAYGVRRVLTMMVFINFPIMIGIAVTARPVVLVLFTDKWASSIPYLQLLAVLGLLYPLHSVNVNVILAQGYSGLCLKLELTKKVLTVLAILITYPYGIIGLICGQIVQSTIAYFINAYFTGKLLGYTWRGQMADGSPYLAASLIMGAAVYAIQFVPFRSELSLLLCQISTGFVVYSGLCFSLRLSAWTDALVVFEDWRRKRRAAQIAA